MDYLYEKDLTILHLLARRSNPNFKFSNDITHWANYSPKKTTFFCIICNKDIDRNLGNEMDSQVLGGAKDYALTKHGLWHLKETTLIAFM